MIPKAIEIGPITLHTYGLIIGLAILTGWYIAKERSQLYKINKKLFDDWTVSIPIILSIICARLYHVLDYWDIYSKNPIQILAINNGGLGIWGAIIGGILGSAIFSRLKRIEILTLLDLVVPSMILGQAIGRFGNWINQEGFGPPTNLPWRVYINPENRPEQYLLTNHFHPTFLYEALLNSLSFLLLVYFSKKLKKPGQIFALYLIFYSITRFFMEFFRIDTWVVEDLKIAQIIALFGISIGTIMLANIKAKSRVDTP